MAETSGVRVRYRPNELGEGGVVEVLPGVTRFEVGDDNTVFLYGDEDEGEGKPIGFIHPHRWESIMQVSGAER